jgi:hypothetical protein
MVFMLCMRSRLWRQTANAAASRGSNPIQTEGTSFSALNSYDTL